MPGFDLLVAFLAATAIFAYMPGPAMLYAAAQTLAGGRPAGWWAALGIHLGGYVHVIAAAFGLAAVFALVPLAYAALKLAGAAYLVWLGVRMILGPQGGEVHLPAQTRRPAFWNSVLVEVLNPKTALFYLAFLPQFTDPGAAWPIWVQLVVLGTVVNVMFSSADVLCVLLADRLTATLRASTHARLWAARIGGSLLVGLGINLAVSRA